MGILRGILIHLYQLMKLKSVQTSLLSALSINGDNRVYSVYLLNSHEFLL